MVLKETHLKGCFEITPKIFKDERGYFFESFNEKSFFEETNILVHFVQDNQSFSSKGVLRGLHYQAGVYSQAKLVRVIKGEVLDVAVDIRPDSLTFGQVHTVILSEENQKQLYIPRGFAHGFLVLSDTALFFYKCDNYYNKASEGGIIYNEKKLNIDWMFNQDQLIISEKDKLLPKLENAKKVW